MAAVSILLAAYNSEKYIKELVGSILSQSFRDFELVIGDDASSDGTLAALSSFNDGRIRIIENSVPSGGAQNNFFRLLGGCVNDYIMFSDADDFWLPEKVERTLARMKELEDIYGKDTPLLVHTDLAVADEKLDIIAPSLFKYEKLSPERTALNQLLAQNNVTGCTVMINRALRLLVNEQPASSVMHDWWLALAASAFGHIGVVYEPLILYRQHGSNQVGAYDAGDLAASAKRLTAKGRTDKIYAAMFSQAACFAETYRDKLTDGQYRVCRAYGDMAGCGKLKRISAVFKHRFFKNTLLRNIGQLMAI